MARQNLRQRIDIVLLQPACSVAGEDDQAKTVWQLVTPREVSFVTDGAGVLGLLTNVPDQALHQVCSFHFLLLTIDILCQ